MKWRRLDSGTGEFMGFAPLGGFWGVLWCLQVKIHLLHYNLPCSVIFFFFFFKVGDAKRFLGFTGVDKMRSPCVT